MSESKILKGLNEEQKTAVIHKNGPLLVIAGAGTGKTTIITRRIAYIIEQKWAKPSEILALTFTEKAAAEMEERVDLLVPYGYTDMQILTFHAFGDRLLRDFALDLGLPANFKILSTVEQVIFMRQNIFAFDLKHFRPLANPLTHIQALLTHFSRLKDELISPEQYLDYAHKISSVISASSSVIPAKAGIQKIKNMDPRVKPEDNNTIEAEKTLELANAYQRYNELMLQAGNLDYGDQIFLTYKLLKENKNVLLECCKRFKYILVDEFQDTNYAQNEIVKLLVCQSQNITVVGDDDQSIYRFRGASISNILDFKKSFPKTKEVVLNHNYRSTQEILNSSYKLIQNNNPDRLEVRNKLNKKLTALSHGNDPELLYCDTLSCEADTVVKKIKELKKNESLKNNDFAILVRANSQAEPFLQALNLEGIPHEFSGASSLFSQPEIKMLVAFLKCLVYSDDNLNFYQLATSELYDVSHQGMTELYTLVKRSNRGIIEIIKRIILNRGSTEISDSDVTKLEVLIKDLEEFIEKKNDPVGEILYEYLSKKKYLARISKNPSLEDELKVQHIAKFFDRISQFSHASQERGVLKFLENLELILEVGDEIISSDIDLDLDAVNVLTVHAAKGLEWPVVFIVNCVADRFPSRKKREALPIPEALIKERLPEGDYHLQEERRLFYVATTRAKKYLFLTAADDYGGKRTKKLSLFALELLDEPKPERLKHKLSPQEKINRFKKLKTPSTRLTNPFKSEILRLSRQQIDDYYSCPKKFYFAHIIKIPLLENQQLMYGTAIHAALDRYFSQKMRGITPSLNDLFQNYNQVFKSVGFITREQEEERYRQGLATLTRFHETEQERPIAATKVEERFEFSENNVKINGRYDLLAEADGNVEIMDFKTSDVREQKEADRRIRDSSQMAIYALAWYESHGKIPKTSLFFIESDLKAEIVYKLSDLEKTRAMIQKVAEGIRNNKMDAKPDHFQCKYCAYKNICSDAI